MSEEAMGRREVISKVLGSAALLSATAANADIDYAGVGFLGGSSTIDVNNANIRVYTKVRAPSTHSPLGPRYRKIGGRASSQGGPASSRVVQCSSSRVAPAQRRRGGDTGDRPAALPAPAT